LSWADILGTTTRYGSRDEACGLQRRIVEPVTEEDF
jgi:hypothetical protein